MPRQVIIIDYEYKVEDESRDKRAKAIGALLSEARLYCETTDQMFLDILKLQQEGIHGKLNDREPPIKERDGE